MSEFELDGRIARDSDLIATLDLCQLRIQNDSRWPWLVMVPQRADMTEIFELSEADQAHLFDVRIAVEAGDLAKADTLLRGILDRTKDEQLALVARLRLSRIQLAQNKPDDALATLSAKSAGAFEARFHEVRGDVLFAKGDKPGALKEYLAALASTDARSVDTQSLQLKINDLKAETTAAAAAAPAPANGAK